MYAGYFIMLISIFLFFFALFIYLFIYLLLAFLLSFKDIVPFCQTAIKASTYLFLSSALLLPVTVTRPL